MTVSLLLKLLNKYWQSTLFVIVLALFMMTAIANSNLREDIKHLKVEHKLEVTELKVEYVETARDIERKAYEQQTIAVNEYKKREQVLVANVASANASVDSLSNTVSEVSAAAKINAELGDRYIDTSRRIITECGSEYKKMGEIASRLSNEVRLLSDANKRD